MPHGLSWEIAMSENVYAVRLSPIDIVLPRLWSGTTGLAYVTAVARWRKRYAGPKLR